MCRGFSRYSRRWQMDRILIDTNVIDYATKKQGSVGVQELLQQLKVNNIQPAVSAYSTFEAYRGLDPTKVSTMREVISKLNPLEVDLKSFKIAALLYTCYQRNSATKQYLDRYKDGDLVLAASAIRYNLPILTANGNDFPRPYFTEMDSAVITVDRKKRPVVIQTLKPDINYFNDQIAEHYVS